MANYSIRDLERISGIKAHTIRIWEKRYGLISPTRTSTNIRNYCDAELKKLLNISILNKNGFKISKVACLSAEEIATSINKITENPCNTESQIENLVIAMIDLDELRFEKILAKATIQSGFEDTVINLLNPFFIRIGIMWQTGSINPAQEHFVSNLVRQKIIVAIDGQISSNSTGSKTFLLLLPEGEMHELGLLFANYLIRKKGNNVIYLGQNVPFNDLMDIAKKRHFDFLVTSFVSSMTKQEIIKYLKNLTGKIPGKMVYVSGGGALAIKDHLIENVKFIDSPQSMITELNSISAQQIA
jgi:DNA-binding transcriptional MerR regulator/methylmalonyl-CoA mutase cobalamin-binding subunit